VHADQTVQTLEILVTRLHESHEVCVYDAIERLVQGGEEVGLGADTLVRMLDRGMRLEDLIEVIEAQMERLQTETAPHDRNISPGTSPNPRQEQEQEQRAA
jgi:hypothetical protein